MRQNRVNSNTSRAGGGFSTIELLITISILTIVTGFGFIGITNARASVRLSGAAREYASYIEKARMFSIRSHADDASERATIAINDDRTSYTVTMDLDGDGVMDTRTITLPDGVTFDTIETISFDWRGRTWNTVAGLTMSNAQVSIRLQNDNDSVSIDVTGSGDITVDSQVFDDSVPDVHLKVGDLSSGATPVPTPISDATPTPDSSPTPDSNPTPTSSPDATPDPGGIDPVPSPTPVSSPTPRPSPTPTPRANPTPTPAPSVCTLSLDLPTISVGLDGTATVKVGHDAGMSLTVNASSSKPSEVQVSPNSQTVSAGGAGTFIIKSKKSIGVYSVTFSTSCGQKVATVVVVL